MFPSKAIYKLHPPLVPELPSVFHHKKPNVFLKTCKITFLHFMSVFFFKTDKTFSSASLLLMQSCYWFFKAHSLHQTSDSCHLNGAKTASKNDVQLASQIKVKLQIFKILHISLLKIMIVHIFNSWLNCSLNLPWLVFFPTQFINNVFFYIKILKDIDKKKINRIHGNWGWIENKLLCGSTAWTELHFGGEKFGHRNRSIIIIYAKKVEKRCQEKYLLRSDSSERLWFTLEIN